MLHMPQMLVLQVGTTAWYSRLEKTKLQSLFLNSCSSTPQRASEQGGEMPKLRDAREGRCDSRANRSSSQLASFLDTLDTCYLFKGIRRERRGGRNGSTGLLPPGIHTKDSLGHLPSSGADWCSWCCTPRKPGTLRDAATPSSLQHLGFGCKTDSCCYTLFPGGDKFVR